MKPRSESEALTSSIPPEPGTPDATPVAGETRVDPATGKGALAREPDAVIALTKHEKGEGFTLEIVLRNASPGQSVVVQSHGLRSGHDQTLGPATRKNPGGQPRLYAPEILLECLGNRRLRTEEWKEVVQGEYGISASRFFDLLKRLRADQRVTCSPIDQRWSQTRSHSRTDPKRFLNQW